MHFIFHECICDNCGHKENTKDKPPSVAFAGWLNVRTNDGHADFCCIDCLEAFYRTQQVPR